MKNIIDKTKLYRGYPIKITDKITIYQPTLNKIIDFGEDRYLNFIHLFTANHLDYNIIIFLTDMGIDFNEMTDWQLFMLLCPNFDDTTCLLFQDLDFSSFKPYSTDNDILILKNKDGAIIDETIYKILVEYIRVMNNVPSPKFTKVSDDPIQKQMAIDDAKRQMESAKNREKYIEADSQLLPFISSAVNSSGFKHNEKNVFDMQIYPFWDSINRLRIIDNAQHLYQGLYSGCLDLKNNPSLKKELDWMRKI